MKIKFCGAAQTVTGSQHLIEFNGKKILLDCGLYQGRRQDAYDINRSFLYDPVLIDCLILSHAHIDHSGNIPTLHKNGFIGDIYCTPATRDLCSIMLLDSAHIQEKDVEYVNRKKAKKGEPPFKPLYTVNDAKSVLNKFKCIHYNKRFKPDSLEGKVEVEFIDAGHILGSAQVVLRFTLNGVTKTLGFTGDLGRPNLPILQDPVFMGNVELLISESTYGGRVHDKSEAMDGQLLEVLQKAKAKGGKVIIPAFSVGRTQELIYSYIQLLEKKLIDPMPVYVDSPLSANATEIFRLHPECFDTETSYLLSMGVDIFKNAHIKYIRDAEDSKKLNGINESCIIVSASGMAESGRILHHLKNNITDEKNIILIIGFMAEHTLGRRLIESREDDNAIVKIFGEEYPVNAEVIVLNSFSAHADNSEMLDYFKNYDKKILQQVYLVHGEPDRQQDLITNLNNAGFGNVFNPAKGEEIEF